jgi:hypothetical protein
LGVSVRLVDRIKIWVLRADEDCIMQTFKACILLIDFQLKIIKKIGCLYQVSWQY